MRDLLERLGISEDNPGYYSSGPKDTSGETVTSTNPTTGESLASVTLATLDDYHACVAESQRAFAEWLCMEHRTQALFVYRTRC